MTDDEIIKQEEEAQEEQAPELAEERPEEEEQERRRKRRLLLVLALLTLLLLIVACIFVRYVQTREPLPELVPLPAEVNYPPHYLFSIYGVDKPVGVAVSPDGQRIYVAENGGDRLIKVFNRKGELLSAFAPPNTRAGERAPVYMAVDRRGRLYVTDRLQHAIYIYSAEGSLLETILGPDLSLSEYLANELGDFDRSGRYGYNIYQRQILYLGPQGERETLPAPEDVYWAPLGVRVDARGQLLVTDVADERHRVFVYPSRVTTARRWDRFGEPRLDFGETGQEPGQLLFPNTAVTDSQGRVYITDGNNGRISVWDREGNFLFIFGRGGGESALSLPRGAFVDERDRLYVVDAVGQNVKVFDVSGEEPNHLYTFGDWGLDDGLFNYPGDIAVDATGRLYITDRENHRVQVWSY